MSQGRVHTFASLLEDVDFIEIPIIQRDYAQGRARAADVRKAFLNALRTALQPDTPVLDLDFVYGSVTTDGARHLSVLDGQQRLTTLFLLHWYLASREGQMEDFRRRWLTPGDARSRFSYATRPSAAEFFQALTRSDVAVPDGTSAPLLSGLLIDAKWFFDSWRRDPTVNSCLVMLDAIHDSFGSESPGKYAALVERGQVTFHFLNLHNFGLSDDLYIKMNARGKPLTPFENFKAWLVERASDAPGSGEFVLGLDQRWLDFFWELSGRSGAVQAAVPGQADYDDLFLRFFYLQAFFDTCLGLDDRSWMISAQSRAWLAQIREARGYVPLRDFDTHGVLHAKGLSDSMHVLNFFSASANAAFRTILAKALAPRAGYEEQLQLFALSAFIRAPGMEGLADEEREGCMRRWLRVTSNLIQNSRIDDIATAASIIKGLEELATHGSNLYQALADKAPTQRGFSREQAIEESRKAILILQDPDWEDVLQQAESNWYLQGRIGFLLDLAVTHTSTVDMMRFKTYAGAMQRVVTRHVLESPKHLLQRALLSLYDYLPKASSGNHTFCIPNGTAYRDRTENWLAVFQDPQFKTLLDAVDEDGPASLERLIAANSATGWRRHVVANPKLIAYCSMSLVRKSSRDMLLLSKSRLTGYFAEVHSLALYHELLNRRETGALPNVRQIGYKFVYGDEWPGVRVYLDHEFLVSYREGTWQCTKADGEFVPLPEELAVVVQETSAEATRNAN